MGQAETQNQASDASVKDNKTTTKKGKAWYKNIAIWCALGGVIVVAVVICVVLSMLNKKSYEIIDLKGSTVKAACETAKGNGWTPYVTIWSSGGDYRQGDCYSELEVRNYEYDGGYCWGISSSSSTKKNVCIEAYDNGYTGVDMDEPTEVEEEIVEEVEEEPAPQTNTNTSTEQQPQSSSSSNSEWKQFLKDYEAWVDKYVAFMKRYQNASSTDMASMLSEYSSLLSDLTSWSERTQNMQSGLSGSDLTEYLETLSRIAQKMNSF